MNGTYALSGGWNGSMRGTLVAGRCAWNGSTRRWVSRLCTTAGSTSAQTGPARGDLEGTNLAAGSPSSGTWVASKVDDESPETAQ